MGGPRPQLRVVAGPNGAGKTTLVADRIVRRTAVVNPNSIGHELPPMDGRPDERRAGKLAIERREALLAAGEDFAFETTLSGNSALRFMRAARSTSRKITLVFVRLRSANLSMARVAKRVEEGGHSGPVPALLRRFPNTLTKPPEASRLADRSFILDNSDARRRLLLVREAGRIRFLARDLPAWLTAMLPDLG